MELSAAIVKLREASGLTQKKFASQLNLSHASLSHFETGDRKPDPGSLVYLTQAALKAKHVDLAETFAAGLPGVRERLLVPAWRASSGNEEPPPEPNDKFGNARLITPDPTPPIYVKVRLEKADRTEIVFPRIVPPAPKKP